MATKKPTGRPAPTSKRPPSFADVMKARGLKTSGTSGNTGTAISATGPEAEEGKASPSPSTPSPAPEVPAATATKDTQTHEAAKAGESSKATSKPTTKTASKKPSTTKSSSATKKAPAKPSPEEPAPTSKPQPSVAAPGVQATRGTTAPAGESVDEPTPGSAATTEPVDAPDPKPPVKKTAVKKTPAKKPSAPARPRSRAKSETTPRTLADVTDWPEVDVPIDLFSDLDARRVKVAMTVPRTLLVQMSVVSGMITLHNPEWTAEHGVPTTAAVKEGLLRLGLWHLDDPDLFHLIPIDLRRRGAQPVVTIPRGKSPTKPKSPTFPAMEYIPDGSSRVADTTYLTEPLNEAVPQIGVTWATTHSVWLEVHDAVPGVSAFREGLIRLGLKHVADPELLQMIPRDARRRR